ncbi:MAG TPA: YncE family protein [Actinomycetes bacterium]
MANARAGAVVLVVALAFGTAGCEFPTRHREVAREAGEHAPATAATGAVGPGSTGPGAVAGALPGMPPLVDPGDVYAADRPGRLSAKVRGDPALIYVPNSGSNTVAVIDQHTRRVIRQFPTGAEPQHVTPSWDLRTLWVGNDQGNSLTPINPATGRPGRPVRVVDPYNLYFTADGRFAVVVAERLGRLDFRDPHSMRLEQALPVPCQGVDHLDVTADGRVAVASCEFSGQLVKVGLPAGGRPARVLGVLRLPVRAAMPQDVRLAPDGRVVYVADQGVGGVWLVDPVALRVVGLVRTGRGAHGLVISRDATRLFVANRGEGSIGVVSVATRKVVGTWRLPGGASPDMGGVSADGRLLWLSGRYQRQVYAIDTRTGRLVARIGVGAGPHGVCVWPQPGRYSLGHTGTLR